MIDEKPLSMSLSNFFVKKTAIKTLVPESIVEEVIRDQWKQLSRTIKSGQCWDHEISGFAYLQVSRKKLENQLVRLTKLFIKFFDAKEKAEKEGNLKKIDFSENWLTALISSIENLALKKKKYENRFQRIVKWDSEQDYRSRMDKRNSKKETGDL